MALRLAQMFAYLAAFALAWVDLALKPLNRKAYLTYRADKNYCPLATRPLPAAALPLPAGSATDARLWPPRQSW
jgi:hypothetical protein